jgi:hypothetical protein
MNERDALDAQLRDRGYRLVDSLPEQTPDVPPRYRFRPRGDQYAIPRFQVSTRPDPYEPVEVYDYDPANDPRPLDWRELANPTLIVSAALVVFAAGLCIAYFLTTGPA